MAASATMFKKQRRRVNIFYWLNDDTLIRSISFLDPKNVLNVVLTCKYFIELLPRLLCEVAGEAHVPRDRRQNETDLMLLAFLQARHYRSAAGELKLARWGTADVCWRPAKFHAIEPPTMVGAAPIRVRQVVGAEYIPYRDYTMVVLDESGCVWSMGSGVGQAPEQLRRVEGLPQDVVYIATGGRSSAAVLKNGHVWVWGVNNHGKLGILDDAEAGGEAPGDGEIPPTHVSIPEHVSEVACGYNHVIFVATNGNVYSCGNNARGQLGLGDLIDRRRPTLVVMPEGKQRVLHAAVGSGYTLLLAHGTILGCGEPLFGEMGGPPLMQTKIVTFTPAFGTLPACGSLRAVDMTTSIVTRSGELWVSGYGLGRSMGSAGYGHFQEATRAHTPAPVACFHNSQTRSVAVLRNGRAVFYGDVSSESSLTPCDFVVIQAAVSSSYRAVITRSST